MFIGSTYELAEAQEEKTMFGWGRIKVMERVLSSTRTQIRDDVHITSYSYNLLCLVDGEDTAEIEEDELRDEVISGYYKLAGWKK
jgi:hypothetical protein